MASSTPRLNRAKAIVLVALVAGVGMIAFSARHILFPRVSRDAILHDGSFRFSFQSWNWESGVTTTFSCDASGRVTYFFEEREMVERDGRRVSQPYRRVARFTATGDEVRGLREAIANNSFFELNDEYIDPDIRDGSTPTFSATVGDTSKNVRCSNLFPDEVIAIRTYVYERILNAHREDIRRAERESGAPPAKSPPTVR